MLARLDDPDVGSRAGAEPAGKLVPAPALCAIYCQPGLIWMTEARRPMVSRADPRAAPAAPAGRRHVGGRATASLRESAAEEGFEQTREARSRGALALDRSGYRAGQVS